VIKQINHSTALLLTETCSISNKYFITRMASSHWKLSEILMAVDSADFTTLTLLDLSAVFAAVNHQILLQHFQTSFAINSSALQWSRLYFLCRRHYVRCSATSSAVHGLSHSAQVSPCPSLFILYTANLAALVTRRADYQCTCMPTILRHLATARNLTSRGSCQMSWSVSALLQRGRTPSAT